MPPTASLELPRTNKEKALETKTDKPFSQIVHVQFEKNVRSAVPEGYIGISELVTEFEAEPDFKKEMSESRKWVEESFYAGEPIKISTLRLKNGFSQTQLAEALGTSQSHVARIEAGTDDIRFSTIEKLARALGVSDVDILRALKSTQK